MKNTLYECLKNMQILENRRLQERFPSLLEFSKSISVIEWDDSYNTIENQQLFEILEKLYEENKIKETDYKRIKKFFSERYVEGISFIEEKKVAFKNKNEYEIMHELGHIYFNVSDLLWHYDLDGGEKLLWIALKDDRYIVREKNIENYHTLLKQTYNDYHEVHDYIVQRIAPKLNIYPHISAISLHARYIPHGCYFLDDLKTEKWKDIEVTREHIFKFFSDMLKGLEIEHTISIFYAQMLNLLYYRK